MIKSDLLADLLAIELAPKIRRRLEHYTDAPSEVWSVIFEEDRRPVPDDTVGGPGAPLACWAVAPHGYPHTEDVWTFASWPSRHSRAADRKRIALAVQGAVLRHGGWVPRSVGNKGELGAPPPWEALGWSKTPPVAASVGEG